MQDDAGPFSGAQDQGRSLCWTAPSPGRAWCPLPDQVGPLVEADLYLLRLAWDLTPEDGAQLWLVPASEVAARYAEHEELARVELEAGWGLGPEGQRVATPGPALLVRPKRFGDLVEVFSFENRDEAGVTLGFVACPDLAALGQCVDALHTEGVEADLDAHAHARGVLFMGAATKPAQAALEAPGEGGPNLMQAVGAVARRMREDVASIEAAQDARTATRRVLARLLG